MAFLTIAGLDVTVVADGAVEQAPVLIGGHDRAVDGRQTGYIVAEYPVLQFTTYRLTQDAWDALCAATPPGALVTCTGDALADHGGPGLFVVRRSARVTWDPDDEAAYYVATLTLEGAG